MALSKKEKLKALSKVVKKGGDLQGALFGLRLARVITDLRHVLWVYGVDIGKRRINRLLKPLENIEKSYRARAIKN